MKFRSKRVILPTIAAVAALGIGGVVWSSDGERRPSGQRA